MPRLVYNEVMTTKQATIHFKGTKEPLVLNNVTAADQAEISLAVGSGLTTVVPDRGWAPGSPEETWPQVTINGKLVTFVRLVSQP